MLKSPILVLKPWRDEADIRLRTQTTDELCQRPGRRHRVGIESDEHLGLVPNGSGQRLVHCSRIPDIGAIADDNDACFGSDVGATVSRIVVDDDDRGIKVTERLRKRRKAPAEQITRIPRNDPDPHMHEALPHQSRGRRHDWTAHLRVSAPTRGSASTAMTWLNRWNG